MKPAKVTDINYLNIKIVCALATLMLLVLFGLMGFNAYNISKIKSFNEELVINNLSLTLQVKDLKKKNADLKLEFDTFKDLTSDEFEKTWRSFGRVRANFLAFGLGEHLEDKDIAPEKYWVDDMKTEKGKGNNE